MASDPLTPDDPEFPWRPTRVHGRVAIQLFTSLRWMNEAVGSSRFVMPTFLEVVSAWPDAAWTLVLNPGTPVDAAIPGEQVRALSGPVEPPMDQPAETAFPTAPLADAPAPRSDAPVDAGPAPLSTTAPEHTATPAFADVPEQAVTPDHLSAPERTDAPGQAEKATPVPAEPASPAHLGAPGHEQRGADGRPGTPLPGEAAPFPGDETGRARVPGETDAPEPRDLAGSENATSGPEVAGPAGPHLADATGGMSTPDRTGVAEGTDAGGAADGLTAGSTDTPQPATAGNASVAGQASVPGSADFAGHPDPVGEPQATPQSEFVGRADTGDETGTPTPAGIDEPAASQLDGAGQADVADQASTSGLAAATGRTNAPQRSEYAAPGDAGDASTLGSVAEGAHTVGQTFEPQQSDVTDRAATGGHDVAGPDPAGRDATDRPDVPGRPDTAGHSVAGTPDTAGHSVAGTPDTAGRDLGGNAATEPADTAGRADMAGRADVTGRDAIERADVDERADTAGGAGVGGGAEVAGRSDGAGRSGAAGESGAVRQEDRAGQTAASGVAGRADAGGRGEAGGRSDSAAAPDRDGAAEAEFEPGNRIDQELFEAALAGDSDAFLRVLLAANVLVPIPQDAPLEVTPTQREFRWEAALRGPSAVQVFTSLVRLREVLPESRFVYADFRELIAAWPREDWAMLLNPRTRIGASLRGDQVRALSDWAIRVGLIQPVPEPEPDSSTLTAFAHAPGAEPGTRPEAADERAAATSGEHHVTPPGDAASNAPTEAAETTGTAGPDALRASGERHDADQSAPDRTTGEASGEASGGQRVGATDDRHDVEYSASGGASGEPRGAERSGAVEAYAQDGFAAVGPEHGPRPGGAEVVEAGVPAPQVPGGVDVPRGPGVRGPVMPDRTRPGAAGAGREDLFDGVATFGGAGERHRLAEPDGEVGTEPTVMQKVVPHAHVAWYLDQGYDRVGGFVHPTSDVAELLTPAQLYETLGLLYEDSPFSPADDSVHVIRWPAYCPDLYRVPFGGRTEEDVASWGDAGWVLERPPFGGDGFAPGSAGSIREYKVDSVRLPYGAEMYVLGRDGSERFVALYDPDRLAWLRPEGAASGGQAKVAR
ncbi:hypothetical protein DZF91_06995 [Actinomadura logoneensis]|uniref:SseB protein N-terminal domain-containing protein n=1 Tax=Actinomadura logoneensis TaxID=2293572 RepID=A0A372JQQ5_9ACTN|nr:SseB family protein [Actinomadura logoneensis]RFU42351.1 hypothetical protein DZF91_06995 [Actinomadura logoneensis]